jgi:hypothetical protein
MQVLCNLGKTSIRNFEKYVNNDLQVNSNKHMLYQPVCRFDPNATSPSAPQPGFEQICVSTLLGASLRRHAKGTRSEPRESGFRFMTLSFTQKDRGYHVLYI